MVCRAITTIATRVDGNGGSSVMESVVDASDMGADPTVNTLGVPPVTPTTPRPADGVDMQYSVLGVLPGFSPVTSPIGAVNTSTPASPPGPVMVTLTVISSRVLYLLVHPYLLRVTWEVFIAP